MTTPGQLGGGASTGPPSGGRGHGGRPRARWRWVLAALLVLPLVELAVIVATGRWIGVGWTLLALIVMTVLGAWLVGREGRRSWGALRRAVNSGRMPGRELADALVVLVGGIMLLTPGFVTDLVGLSLLLPWTRPAGRRLVEGMVSSRVVRVAPPGWPPGAGTPFGGPGSHGEDIVEGEVVDDEPREDGRGRGAGGVPPRG
ncbi:FxsA family protein [Ornithinicoccus halotolerans]|uniref:FxsA family protein n=1 Tax=Ornithinicoccus halotolerans TaxID=1748220 RepID=UPI001E383296|nr:FxsA family protein [Ornithinicoccus halotolerans]